MNHREGRFGMQEAASACGLSALLSGMFTLNPTEVYRQGNVCWLATLLGLLGAALVFLGLLKAMEKQGADSLDQLLKGMFRPAAGLAALPLLVLFVLAAALPSFHLLVGMNRYVFEGADYVHIAPYQLFLLGLLALLGMETIGRVSRMLVLPGVLSIGIAIYLASPAFAWYHLFPLLGGGMEVLLEQSVQALLRFLPPVLALCAVGRGCQSQAALKRSGMAGLFTGGMLAAALQFFLGMTFFSWDLPRIRVPLYRMATTMRYDAVTMRLDVITLFVWVICALAAGAFYVYAGALVFVRLHGLEDIRPAAAGMSALSMGCMLLLHLDADILNRAGELVYRWGWLLGALPCGLLLPGAFGSGKKRREPV